MRLLLVEDDKETARYVSGPRSGGTPSTWCPTARTGCRSPFARITTSRSSTACSPAWTACRWRARWDRRQSRFDPVPDLSAVSTIAQGLDVGGDDYLVKPFAFAELLARVSARRRAPCARRRPACRRPGLDVASRKVTRAQERSSCSQERCFSKRDAEQGPGRHPHHAARASGVPFRPAHQRRRGISAIARQDRPALCETADSYHPRQQLLHQ